METRRRCRRWSAAGPRIAATDAVGNVAVYDLQRRTEIARWKTRHNPHEIAISPDGRQVAIAWWDQRAYVDVFDVAGPSMPRHVPADQCNALAFSPDGRLLGVGSMDNLLVYDNTDEGRLVYKLVGHSAGITDAAFCPEGRLIATVSNDRRLKLWEVASGNEIQSTEAHRGDVCGVDFSHDGRGLVTCGEDGMIRLWHTETMQPMLEIVTGDSAEKVRFTAHDRQLIVLLGNDETVVYDASPQVSP